MREDAGGDLNVDITCMISVKCFSGPWPSGNVSIVAFIKSLLSIPQEQAVEVSREVALNQIENLVAQSFNRESVGRNSCFFIRPLLSYVGILQMFNAADDFSLEYEGADYHVMENIRNGSFRDYEVIVDWVAIVLNFFIEDDFPNTLAIERRLREHQQLIFRMRNICYDRFSRIRLPPAYREIWGIQKISHLLQLLTKVSDAGCPLIDNVIDLCLFIIRENINFVTDRVVCDERLIQVLRELVIKCTEVERDRFNIIMSILSNLMMESQPIWRRSAAVVHLEVKEIFQDILVKSRDGAMMSILRAPTVQFAKYLNRRSMGFNFSIADNNYSNRLMGSCFQRCGFRHCFDLDRNEETVRNVSPPRDPSLVIGVYIIAHGCVINGIQHVMVKDGFAINRPGPQATVLSRLLNEPFNPFVAPVQTVERLVPVQTLLNRIAVSTGCGILVALIDSCSVVGETSSVIINPVEVLPRADVCFHIVQSAPYGQAAYYLPSRGSLFSHTFSSVAERGMTLQDVVSASNDARSTFNSLFAPELNSIAYYIRVGAAHGQTFIL